MWYNIGLTLLYIAFFFFNPVRVRGRGKLTRGAAILCPNHTTMKDAVYMALAAGYRHKTFFMAKEELLDKWIFKVLFRILPAFTVKRGSGDIAAIKKSIEVIKRGRKLVIFPEGTRVREGMQVDAKAGAAMLAAKTNVPLFPVNISNGRKFFRLVTVTIGDPITVEVSDRSRASEIYRETAQQIMKEIHTLGQS